MVAQKPYTTEEIEQLSRSALALKASLDGAKGMRASYDTLKLLATRYIQAHERWQVAKHGKVTNHLRVSSLIR